MHGAIKNIKRGELEKFMRAFLWVETRPKNPLDSVGAKCARVIN